MYIQKHVKKVGGYCCNTIIKQFRGIIFQSRMCRFYEYDSLFCLKEIRNVNNAIWRHLGINDVTTTMIEYLSFFI